MAGEHKRDKTLNRLMRGGKIRSTDKEETAKDRENYRNGWEEAFGKKSKTSPP